MARRKGSLRLASGNEACGSVGPSFSHVEVSEKRVVMTVRGVNGEVRKKLILS